jgi:hypothetical protein
VLGVGTPQIGRDKQLYPDGMGEHAAAVWAGWPGHNTGCMGLRSKDATGGHGPMTYGMSYGNTWGECELVGAGGLGWQFTWYRWPAFSSQLMPSNSRNFFRRYRTGFSHSTPPIASLLY